MELALENIEICLHGVPLFAPLSANVAPGECLTIMGPSGAGKSVLLDYISRGVSDAFEASGHVRVDRIAVETWPAQKRHIGILFQDDLLFPHMTVAENLAFGLADSVKGADRQIEVEKALIDADLEGFGERDPSTLSGGQRARVSCLRMLLSKPRVLLLDEPFSKLDKDLRDRFRRFVFDRIRRDALPTILVTHDQEDADAAGGRIIQLDAEHR